MSCKFNESPRSTSSATHDEINDRLAKDLMNLYGQQLAWPCEIDEGNFHEKTLTLKMLTDDYVVSAGTHWLCKSPPAQAPQRTEQELYHELLFAVAKVHPNETRHQTALRYIQQAESGGADQCTAAHCITKGGEA
jgi:hypothetical protein